jgi:DNA-binding transcriptional LysR family regulator
VADDRWTPWEAYLRARGLPARARGKGLHFTNYVQATQATLSGQGVMLGWRSITGDLVAERRLVPVTDTPLLPSDAFYLVTSPHTRAEAVCSVLAAWLVEAAGHDAAAAAAAAME